MSGMRRSLIAMMKRQERTSKLASKMPELLTGKTGKYAGSHVSLQQEKREENLFKLVMRRQLMKLLKFAKMKQGRHSN